MNCTNKTSSTDQLQLPDSGLRAEESSAGDMLAMLQDNETPGNEEWSIQESGFVACSVQSDVFLVLTFWRVIC